MNKVLCGECSDILKNFENQVNLVVTSPPYDNLRDYNGYSFDFEKVAKAIYNSLNPEGVLVWIVADQTKEGSESGSSFRHALYFMDTLGMLLTDTMIWSKGSFSSVGDLQKRYAQTFEYMFVFTKSKKYPFHTLKDRPNKTRGRKVSGNKRLPNGKMRKMSCAGNILSDTGVRFNVWNIPSESSSSKRVHPASMQEDIAIAHILSWSNPGDLVLDPMCGGGTTLLSAKKAGRAYLGIDVSEEYCEISRKRLENCNTHLKVTNIYKFVTLDGDVKITAETLEEAKSLLGCEYSEVIDSGILKYEEIPS